MWNALALRWTLATVIFVVGAAMVRAEEPPLRGPEASDTERPPERRFDGERPRHHAPGEQLREILKGLNLSEEQRTQVRSIMDKAREEAEKFREENKEKIETLREQLREAHEEGDPDRILELQKEMHAIMKNAPMNPKKITGEIRGVLDEAQARQFDEKLAEAKERMKNRVKEMRERRGPEMGGDPGDRPRRPAPPADQGDKLDL